MKKQTNNAVQDNVEMEALKESEARFRSIVPWSPDAIIGRRTMLLNARQIERVPGKERIILLAIEDITERKLIENLRRLATVTRRSCNVNLVIPANAGIQEER